MIRLKISVEKGVYLKVITVSLHSGDNQVVCSQGVFVHMNIHVEVAFF